MQQALSSTLSEQHLRLLSKYRRHGWYLQILSVSIATLLICAALTLIIVMPNDSSILTYAGTLLFFPLIMAVRHRYKVAQDRLTYVPVTPQQFPHIYALVVEYAQQAGLPRIPQVAITSDPAINPCSRTQGMHPVIVLGTDFVAGCRENNTPEALRFMIAHQIGHAKFGHHSRWWQVCSTGIMSIFGLETLFVRHLEFTADAWAALQAPEGIMTGLGLCAVGKDNYPYLHVSPRIRHTHINYRRGIFGFLAKWSAPVVLISDRIRQLVTTGLLEDACTSSSEAA